MDIAIVNSWPCLPSTAEMEYIKRFILGGRNVGHRVFEVVTSDDIYDCQPDFVITTHEFTPKLTPYFTMGAMWSPPSFFADDPRRIKAVLSYDAYLIGSSKVSEFIDALEFSTGSPKPRSDFLFLPTALTTIFKPWSARSSLSLAYIGVHWDGLRHNGLLEILSRGGHINIYGPEASWRGYAKSYRGSVPFDGSAVSDTLGRHGIALCIHKEEHRLADTPSMRMFEAAAACCLIIADEIPFARRVLGDSAFHIDMREPAQATAKRIAEIIRWANENPQLAGAMATRSHQILNDSYSVEKLVEKCCSFASKAKEDVAGQHKEAVHYFSNSTPYQDVNKPSPLVDIIVRTGGREISKLRRALRSIVRQPEGYYRVLLVDYKSRKDIEECAREETSPRVEIEYLNCPDTGLRSTALWYGLRHVKAQFFAMLDDDDTVMPQHFGALLKVAQDDPDHVLYYSGVVLAEESSGLYVNAVNFAGPVEVDIPERRELKFMERFNLSRLFKYDNYIQSNAWIARSSGLDKRSLTDPRMEVAEDAYLYFMLTRKGSFKLSPTPTAIWHWRTRDSDNSMLQVDRQVWINAAVNMKLRLSQETLFNGIMFHDMDQLLGIAPPNLESTIPVRPAALKTNELKHFNGDLLNGGRRFNLHAPEEDGVWTNSTTAVVHIKLAAPERKLRIRMGFMAAGSAVTGSQHISIFANDVLIFSGFVEPWKTEIAEGSLLLRSSTDVLFLRINCSYVTTPVLEDGTNGRSLGVFLSKISYQPSSDSDSDSIRREMTDDAVLPKS